MLEFSTRGTVVTITSDRFKVIYDPGRPHFFTLKSSTLEQDFYIPAGCDSFDEKDLNLEYLGFSLQPDEECIRVSVSYLSNLWSKTYNIDVYDSHVEFYYELSGNHRISCLHFFEGIAASDYTESSFTKHFNDHKATPYREYSQASPVSFKKLYNPEPNVYGKQTFEYFEYSLISVNSDFVDYCGGNFYFNPGLLCYLFSREPAKEWISLGLSVKNGEYLFSDYEYIGGTHFGLCLNYCGVYEVSHRFVTPKMLIFAGPTEQDVIQAYVEHVRINDLLPVTQLKKYDWWYGPIICPVGHQYYQTDLFRVRSPKERPRDAAGYFACTQLNCENFISLIDKWDIDWGTFIIDVKWFINAGMKIIDVGRWPDMRGFVDMIHRRNKKVIIWWSPWDTEGWANEECILYSDEACGKNRNRPGRFSKLDTTSQSVTRLGPDITLPAVQEKVADQLRHLLGTEGIDLDGVKMDHTAATPGVYGMIFPIGSQRLYGIELMKFYQEFLYRTAKIIKPDALVVGQSPNPYFSDCIDMIRLGDTYGGTRQTVNSLMEFRWRMAKLANQDWLIDMDGWPLPGMEALENYVEFQVAMGVPSLYYATHLDTTGEEIPPRVFNKIREQWTKYRHRRADC